jgi:3'5'-cyclic nucleotide phosphodiesterase
VSVLQDLEKMYNNNAYHNNLHAADVVQSMVALLATTDFTSQLTPLEILAVVMACAVHDVGHPGALNLAECSIIFRVDTIHHVHVQLN